MRQPPRLWPDPLLTHHAHVRVPAVPDAGAAVQGAVLVPALLGALCNLAVNIAYGGLDPWISYG
jgi:hypothetical protein